MVANKKAIAVVGVTKEDIYIGDENNFVFGVANIMTQVGVFSFCRYD